MRRHLRTLCSSLINKMVRSSSFLSRLPKSTQWSRTQWPLSVQYWHTRILTKNLHSNAPTSCPMTNPSSWRVSRPRSETRLLKQRLLSMMWLRSSTMRRLRRATQLSWCKSRSVRQRTWKSHWETCHQKPLLKSPWNSPCSSRLARTTMYLSCQMASCRTSESRGAPASNSRPAW